jgi:hypothetical protein
LYALTSLYRGIKTGRLRGTDHALRMSEMIKCIQNFDL